MKKLSLIKILPFIIASSGVYATPAHENTESAKVDILARTQYAWDGSEYKKYPNGQPELSVLKFNLKPNSVLPWHEHPYPNAGYVLSGTLTIQDKSGHSRTYKQGEGFTESVNHVHRGITGADGAVLIVVYSGVKGVPPSISEPGEKPEF
ncbi:cupin domain-containing protein [Acinetobacter rathckeae]|uniref:cupin domain-containing protein n=1 Tax=Acinetobacter rathckeae TaxID=2605272 RepID=UPI0018A2AACD|nr:cupin domain-containing protein [Acinetobacter rathckeae]MBF7688086.1 cupin domain-containing protein [Acinetobacter rathckeae]